MRKNAQSTQKSSQKKAQIEILGLLMVMVLLSLGMLFVLRFVLLKPAENVQATFADVEMAQNMITSLLKVTTTCKDLSMTELFEDCARYESIDCGDGNTSCTYLNRTLPGIFNQTFGAWHRKYTFNATIATIPPRNVLSVEGNCSAAALKEKPGLQPIPLASGAPLMIRLDLCKP